MDLTTIPDSVLLARGQYATVRAEHESSKKQLQIYCGQLGSIAAQVLRAMQPDNESAPNSVTELLDAGRGMLHLMEAISIQIQSLSIQRAELRPIAWPKKF